MRFVIDCPRVLRSSLQMPNIDMFGRNWFGKKNAKKIHNFVACRMLENACFRACSTFKDKRLVLAAFLHFIVSEAAALPLLLRLYRIEARRKQNQLRDTNHTKSANVGDAIFVVFSFSANFICVFLFAREVSAPTVVACCLHIATPCVTVGWLLVETGSILCAYFWALRLMPDKRY